MSSRSQGYLSSGVGGRRLSAHCRGMTVGGVDGEDGDEGEEEEKESSEEAEGVLAGVGVASFDSGRESKPGLR